MASFGCAITNRFENGISTPTPAKYRAPNGKMNRQTTNIGTTAQMIVTVILTNTDIVGIVEPSAVQSQLLIEQAIFRAQKAKGRIISGPHSRTCQPYF